MKKTASIIFKFSSFVIAFFILLNVFSFVFTPKDGREQGSVYGADSYKAEQKNSVDIFFVGNSNIASAVAPPVIYEKTGLSSCVSGKANQSLDGAYKVLKNMYKTQNPSVVIIETDMIFAGQGREFSREYIKDQLVNIKRICSVVFSNFEDSAMSGMSYYFPVFRHHERWSDIGRDDIIHIEKRCKSLYCGYSADTSVNAHYGGFDYMNTRVDSSIITKNRAKKLEKIISLCNSKGSKIVFLDVPCASSWSKQRHNETVKFAEQAGIEFIDMNIDVPNGFDWTHDTKDAGTHLNISGAKKVSDMVGERISKINITADKRACFDKKNWDEMKNTFERELKKISAS